MKKIFTVLFLLISFNLFAQTTEVVFLQMNDVYEIAPIEGGKYGGLARVSTIKQNLLIENPNTFLFLDGDFISPSALSTSEYDGEKINGKQMIDVLNTIGLDFCTFGNHEFDYKQEILQKRINESNFTWITSNVKTKKGEAMWKFGKQEINGFTGFPEYYILKVPGVTGNYIRIGIIGLCIDENKQPYAIYENYIASAKRVYAMIKDSIDCFVAVTHLEVENDRELARQMPEIQLIMGGHEHTNNFENMKSAIITKADANARTVYINKLKFDADNKLIGIDAKLVTIDETTPEDPKAKEVVDKWVNRAFDGFKKSGFDPYQQIAVLNEPLDGRDEYIRTQPTNLGKAIAGAMLDACPGCMAAVFNSGSVRIDDELMGEISQYDVIRTLPFGGKIIEVEMKGSLLSKLLDTGRKNKGSGGYLQYYNIQYDSLNAVWLVGKDKKKIEPNANYKAAVAAYMLTGMEQNMSFFTADNPDIIKITEPEVGNQNDLRNDVRLALIKYFQKGK